MSGQCYCQRRPDLRRKIDWVACDECKTLFYTQCVEISKQMADTIRNWFCNNCRLGKVNQKLIELTKSTVEPEAGPTEASLDENFRKAIVQSKEAALLKAAQENEELTLKIVNLEASTEVKLAKSSQENENLRLKILELEAVKEAALTKASLEYEEELKKAAKENGDFKQKILELNDDLNKKLAALESSKEAALSMALKENGDLKEKLVALETSQQMCQVSENALEEKIERLLKDGAVHEQRCCQEAGTFLSSALKDLRNMRMKLRRSEQENEDLQRKLSQYKKKRHV